MSPSISGLSQAADDYAEGGLEPDIIRQTLVPTKHIQYPSGDVISGYKNHDEFETAGYMICCQYESDWGYVKVELYEKNLDWDNRLDVGKYSLA